MVIFGGSLYVNPFVRVSVPKSLITTISTCPGTAPMGVSHVMVVEFTMTILVALTPPKVTSVVPTIAKSVPVIVTASPPASAPLSGAIDAIEGGS